MSYTPTIWENGKKPAINATHLNKIENELAKLDNIVSMPDITITDQTTMPNSYDGRLLVEEIGGVCEQASTTGKNLWSYGDIKTVTGSDIEWNVPAGTYTFSSSNSSPNLTIRAIYTDDSSEVITIGGLAKTFTLGKVVYKFNFSNPNVNSITNIQVESGTEATTYEPYTGGIPSPNPSYPQEIKKSVVSEIKTHGKNLFDVSKFVTNQYISGDGSVSANGAWGTSDYMMAKSPSVTISHKDTQWFQLVIAEYDSKKTFIRTTSKQGFLPTATQELSENTSYIRISYSIDVGNGVITREEVMVNEGTTALPYEPYTESSITLSQPIELYGIGDVQDTIYGGKVKRRFASVDLDGSADENWALDTKNKAFYTFAVEKSCKINTLPMCTHYAQAKAPSDFSQDNTCAINVNKVIWFTDRSIDTVDAWKAQLASNPMTVVYELAEEVTEALPLADQIALNSLSTYDGITYLEFDSEIEPTFEGEYGTSKVGGYTLEALLTARSK